MTEDEIQAEIDGLEMWLIELNYHELGKPVLASVRGQVWNSYLTGDRRFKLM
jgi:hypothetical protein